MSELDAILWVLATVILVLAVLTGIAVAAGDRPSDRQPPSGHPGTRESVR